VGLVVGAYLSYVAVRGSRLLVQPEVRPFLPEYTGAPATPADLGLEYEDVRFTTDDGVTLSGWLVPAARDTRTAVIVLHGFSGHRLPELAALVPWLQERHHVLQFDFRGHGESDPSVITLGWHERRDVAAAVRFLEGRGLGPIALLGISMGASTAIVSAPDLPVAAVVADAPYAELHHPVANRMRDVGYPLAELGARAIVAGAALRARTRLRDPLSVVARIAPRPLLIISPTEDRLIDHRQAERLFERAGEPKELYRVPGAGHGEAYATDPEAYRARVLEFLERHLG
jgi:fermentation-respiration switch protein FrsA (DUF1100 family)